MDRLALIALAAGLLQAFAAADAQRSPSDGDAAAVTFVVRVENVSDGGTLKLSTGGSAAIPLSPGVWVVHRGANPILAPGQPDAGLGLEGLAEAGLANAFAANLSGRDGVRSNGVFAEPLGRRRGMPPGKVDRASASSMLQRGQHYQFTITARKGDRLSIAMMISQSNDGVVATGGDAIALFDEGGKPVSGNVTARLALWDAGTEVNEDPGVGRNQGLRQGAPHAGDPERKPVRAMADAEFGKAWPSVERLVRVTITPRP